MHTPELTCKQSARTQRRNTHSYAAMVCVWGDALTASARIARDQRIVSLCARYSRGASGGRSIPFLCCFFVCVSVQVLFQVDRLARAHTHTLW